VKPMPEPRSRPLLQLGLLPLIYVLVALTVIAAAVAWWISSPEVAAAKEAWRAW
jgi:hypothetical protein